MRSQVPATAAFIQDIDALVAKHARHADRKPGTVRAGQDWRHECDRLLAKHGRVLYPKLGIPTDGWLADPKKQTWGGLWKRRLVYEGEDLAEFVPLVQSSESRWRIF